MNAVRTPSIVLLFHSYMFQDLLSLSLYPRSIPREISSRSTRRVGRLAFFATRISPTLSRLRSTADEGEKILRGFIPHAARERSRTFDDHFLFINRASLADPLVEFLESFLFVTDVTPPTTPPKRRSSLAKLWRRKRVSL